MRQQIQPPTVEEPVFFLNLDLFTPEERERCEPVYSKVADRPAREALAALSDEDLYELEKWDNLSRALTAGDTDATKLARERLSMNTEALITAFLAIGEDRVSAEGTTPFTPIMYRSVAMAAQRGTISLSTREDLRRWVSHFNQKEETNR